MSTQGLKLAFALMTRIPVRLPDDLAPRAWGEAVAFYPLVGAVIGLGLAGLGWLAQGLGWLPEVAALVLVLFWIGVTGALHLDGLADSTDAWLGGYGDRDKTLRILKDPSCGPAGAVAMVLAVLVKWVTLGVLLAQGTWGLLLLVLVPVLARAAVVGLFLTQPRATREGLAGRSQEQQPRARLKGALVLSALFALMGGWAGLGLVLLTAAATAWAARLMRARLGGFTGDLAGALIEFLEAALLLVLAL